MATLFRAPTVGNTRALAARILRLEMSRGSRNLLLAVTVAQSAALLGVLPIGTATGIWPAIFILIAAGLVFWTWILIVLSWRVRALRYVLARAARKANARSRELHTTLESVNEGILMVDREGRIRVLTRRAADLLELPRSRLYSRMPYRELVAMLHDRGSLRSPSAAATLEGIATEGQEKLTPVAVQSSDPARAPSLNLEPLASLEPGRIEQRRANGGILDVDTIKLPDGGYVRRLSDVTLQRIAEDHALHLATHDTLTDLTNRHGFREALKGAGDPLRNGASFALHVLDLDHFKNVNDTLGHPIGDELLRLVAGRLQGTVRQGDVVARLGGDEFAILQGDVADRSQARALASRLVRLVSRPYEIEGQHIVIGCTVGVALAPEDSHSGDGLMRAADLALYAAKEAGRGQVRFYDAQMNERIEGRRALEADLRAALSEHQLSLNYQPIHRLSDERIVGFEALLRWRHPVRGMVSPAEFIPIAEESGLIAPIGAWVIDNAFAEAARWAAPLRLAINLSPAQLSTGDVTQTIRRALERTGLTADRVDIELTETAILHSDGGTRQQLEQLEGMGLAMSMDDFGTGYSSLSYLRTFAFDKIKIDRSFVADVGVVRDSTAIIETIADLARRLEMTTTAEGIETPEQLAHLRTLGCTEGQGYHFSKPRPPEELAAYIDRHGIADAPARSIEP